jgi:hypothetical protein
MPHQLILVGLSFYGHPQSVARQPTKKTSHKKKHIFIIRPLEYKHRHVDIIWFILNFLILFPQT